MKNAPFNSFGIKIRLRFANHLKRESKIKSFAKEVHWKGEESLEALNPVRRYYITLALEDEHVAYDDFKAEN